MGCLFALLDHGFILESWKETAMSWGEFKEQKVFSDLGLDQQAT